MIILSMDLDKGRGVSLVGAVLQCPVTLLLMFMDHALHGR
jgi:hypothetical protein